jgi:hypothetical protein
VVTDGSNLYPGVLAELWSDAAHQLCVFHVIKDVNILGAAGSGTNCRRLCMAINY